MPGYLSYSPRQIDKSTIDEMDKWLRQGYEGSPEQWRALLSLIDTDETKARAEELGRRGTIAKGQEEQVAQSIPGLIWALEGKLQNIPDELLPREFADEISGALRGPSALRNRPFLPNVKSIQELNKIIAEIFEIAANKNGIVQEEFMITRFYNLDPVDQWVRYTDHFNDSLVTFDILKNMEDLRLYDVVPEWGMEGVSGNGRAASFSGSISFQEEGGTKVLTYEYPDPHTGQMRTVSRGLNEGDKIDEVLEAMKEELVATHPEYRAVQIGDTFVMTDRMVQEELARSILPKLKD